MASFIYNSAISDLVSGNINAAADNFKIMLVTSAYTADKKAHSKRNQVTNEVTGTSYTAGGAASTASVATNSTNNTINITFGAVSWTNSTITARGAVIYKSRNGAASADELVAYIDFVTDQISSNGSFSLGSSIITFQN